MAMGVAPWACMPEPVPVANESQGGRRQRSPKPQPRPWRVLPLQPWDETSERRRMTDASKTSTRQKPRPYEWRLYAVMADRGIRTVTELHRRLQKT